jgi:two-component system, OmpR family, sensor kinase
VRRAFDTLAARTALVSLIGITLVHLLSLWTYEQALHRQLGAAHQAQLAERLVAIKRSVALVVPSRREKVAHELSGGPVDAHWSSGRITVAGGPGIEHWKDLADQVRRLAPELRPDDVLVGTSTDGDPHVALIALQLPDQSWVNISIFAASRPAAGSHGSILSTSLMALGVLLLSFLIARWLTRPIRSAARAAASLSPEGPAVDLEVSGPVEVRELTTAFNAMQRRIADLVHRRTQALAAVSHDLRTPLTRLKLRVDELQDADLRGAVLADVDEMERMIDATLSYLKGHETAEPARAIDLVALLQTMVDDARDRGRVADLTAPRQVVIEARLVSLRRAMANLVDNALRYGDRVSIVVRELEGAVEVTITDDGPGIPEDRLGTVLEPFVRLESSRNPETGGVGLGLTIAKTHIEAHGGSLALANRPEGGLSVTVTLLRKVAPPGPTL